MSFISRILGIFVKFVYDSIATILPSEPHSISFFALSIIVTTIILKIIILPLSISQIKSQKQMAKLQPELKKLQQKYKNDPQTLAKKQQQLYKESNYNMLSGCLPIILQMVVLIAFYRVFLYPETYAFTDAAFFKEMNKNFFYLQNIELKDHTVILPLLAAVTTFLMSYITTKNPATKSSQDQAQSMMTGMMIVMPILIFSMGRRFAAGLVIYWTVSNLFAIIQQIITNRMMAKDVEEA